MKNKLAYSPEALADLDEIWDYICAESGEPDIASNVVEGILNTIDQQQNFAQMGVQVAANAGMRPADKPLSCYITSNLRKTQILGPNLGGTINADWTGTPKLFQSTLFPSKIIHQPYGYPFRNFPLVLINVYTLAE